MNNRLLYRVVCLGLLLTITGCASNLPREITSAPVPDLSVTTVQKDAKANKGKLVRWGGIIIGIENLKQKSILEVLAKPLDSYGQPSYTTTSSGRFFAEINGFVDPSVYAPGRELTLFGTVTGIRTSKIGEHEYHYPVIEASKYYLWKKSAYYWRDPYWDDDWYWGYYGPSLWFSWDYYGHPHPHPHPHPPFFRH